MGTSRHLTDAPVQGSSTPATTEQKELAGAGGMPSDPSEGESAPAVDASEYDCELHFYASDYSDAGLNHDVQEYPSFSTSLRRLVF